MRNPKQTHARAAVPIQSVFAFVANNCYTRVATAWSHAAAPKDIPAPLSDLEVPVNDLDDDLRPNFCHSCTCFSAGSLNSNSAEKALEELCVGRTVYAWGPYVGQLEK